MAQKLIQTQEQKQIQIQRLSQQQMLQVKLLEMPLTELEESINSELDDNPALEMGENDEPQSTDTNLLDGDSELTEEEKSEREEREDALERAFAFRKAGADAIMIHSRKKDPTEIFTFVERFREKEKDCYIVVVPTSFNSVKEEEFKRRGVNVVIYANQLMRATVPAIQKAATLILEKERAEECDSMLMPFQDIIRLIPEEE